MTADELDTPVPVIDLDIVERNLAAMQAYCDEHGLRLRPHIKTHKLPCLARRQIELGAVGITCQKLGEAEVMVGAGLNDILISFPIVGAPKVTRLSALARRATIRVAIDNRLALDTAAQAARAAGVAIGILVEFDSGMHRTGVVAPDEAVDLARRVAATPNLRFDGLMTYPATEATSAFLHEAMALLRKDGLPISIVSGGGTPRSRHAHTFPGLTEYRVGTYIYNDRNTVAVGAATVTDCAMTVLATIVSRPTPDRAVIDAGSKTLSSDPASAGRGFGILVEYPDAIIERLNEEHGMLDLSQCRGRPVSGERVRIIPNHCCVVTNLHDEVVAVRGDEVIGAWPVAARGRTT